MMKSFWSSWYRIPSMKTRALGRDFKITHIKLSSSEDIENANIEMLKEAIVFTNFLTIIESDKITHRKFTGIPMLSRHDLFYNPISHREMYDLQEKLVWQLKALNQYQSYNDLHANYLIFLTY